MPKNIEELETQDLDTSAALADISSDLFGQGESGGSEARGLEGEKSDSSEPSAVESASPQSDQAPSGEDAPKAAVETPEGATNSAEVQALGAPSTWTKEAIAEWATVPPRIQQEILKRESDFLNGITQYKTSAELGARYNAVVEPYSAALAAENVDPVQLFQSFAANHYLLSRGSDAQKIELAANLINGYGIDLNSLIAYIGDRRMTPVDPELQALQREVNSLKAERERTAQQEQQLLQTKIESEIDAFASDPAHPHFNELIDDIAKLMKSGSATSLTDAYEKAVWANPVTRQKELDRLTADREASAAAAANARQAKVASLTSTDVHANPTQRNGTVPIGSMDDTLAATLQEIQSRS